MRKSNYFFNILYSVAEFIEIACLLVYFRLFQSKSRPLKPKARNIAKLSVQRSKPFLAHTNLKGGACMESLGHGLVAMVTRSCIKYGVEPSPPLELYLQTFQVYLDIKYAPLPNCRRRHTKKSRYVILSNIVLYF